MKLRTLITLSTLLFCCNLLAQQNPTPDSIKIIYVGDSVTAGYGIDDQKAYPWLVQKKLSAKGLKTTTINASVSGSLSSSAEQRVRWVLKQNPQVIVLALGGNDGLKATPTKEIAANLQKAILLAQKNKVIVVLAGFKIFSNLGERYTQDFEAIYKNLGAKHNIILTPFLLQGVGADPQYNIADGKHPNEKGHEKIADVVYDFILKAVTRASESQKYRKSLPARQ